MKREELEKTEEYDFVIRFKSNKPKYEIRSYIINHILDEFDNLQMWDFKRSSEFAEPREKRIAELEAQIEKMKRCIICKHYSCISGCSYHSNWVKDCKENGMKLFELKE